ncbi:TetR/AcrR family transcriptional regulator [Paenibacillus sp. CAU 1782]
MSRPREFDVDRALHQSMEVFWTKGFKSTSYDDLTRATQVKKQSFYCLFKDKRALFIKALALYREQSVAVVKELAAEETPPLEKLKAISDAALHRNKNSDCRGCLMVNSVLEFGTEDEEVTREIKEMFHEVEQIIEIVIQDGQKRGAITSRLTSKELAVYLNNVWSGIKMMEKSGSSEDRIDVVLNAALALLEP